LNSSILSDARFLPQFRTYYEELLREWREWRGKSADNFGDGEGARGGEEAGRGTADTPPEPDWAVEWWEHAKPAIAQFCKDISILLAKERRVTKNFLFASLKTATKRGDWALVARHKERLRAILIQEVNGLVVRSRSQQNVEEERATLFHQNKEVKMTQKRKLTKMKLEAGQTTEDEDEIAEEC
jgi:hypothetical protein